MKGGQANGARIVALSENTAAGQGLLAEHGLAFWIERGRHRLLFDTGQGYVLRHNAQRLAIDLAGAETIVLSHGHFDHTGGLAGALALANRPRVVAHPAAFERRYARMPDGRGREIGMPGKDRAAVREKATPVITDKPAEVVEGVFVTGPVPRITDYEDTGGPFFTDEACTEPDLFPDDQALYFDTPRGLVVLLGCAHAGMINTVTYVRELTGGRPVHTLVGGTHLVGAGAERLDRTVEALRPLKIQWLMPAHCTGFPATARLWHEFPASFAPCRVGTVIDVDDAAE